MLYLLYFCILYYFGRAALDGINREEVTWLYIAHWVLLKIFVYFQAVYTKPFELGGRFRNPLSKYDACIIFPPVKRGGVGTLSPSPQPTIQKKNCFVLLSGGGGNNSSTFQPRE